MAVIGTDYVPVRPKLYPKSRDSLTVDSKFWKSFKAQRTEQQIAAVSSIHFSPVSPYDFAVTSSTRVTIYNGKTREVKKNISRFSDVAYSGAYRGDGQLIVAGGESGLIQVFDATSRTVLRQLKGHKRAVHWVRYSLEDRLHVLSAGDDNSVRWWDVASQTQLFKMEQHTDYVRCGASSPSSEYTWATGSYDHSVRLWDVRAAKCVLQLKQETPLEDVIFFPSGGLVATAGGNVVNIWDVVGGGKLLYSLANHQKTVTKLCFTSPDIAGTPSPRLVSASLDGHVRMFELEKFKVTHAAKYSSGSILSMDISPACTTLVVGMSNGALAIRDRRKVAELDDLSAPALPALGEAATGTELMGMEPLKPPPKKPLNPNSHRYFLRGRTEKASESDHFYAREKKINLTRYDVFLRKFRYRDALTTALRTSDPKVVVAVMEELVARKGLVRALTNLDNMNLVSLMSFLAKQAMFPKYARLLIPVTLRVLDMYEGTFRSIPAINRPIAWLKERVTQEVQLLVALQVLQGTLEPLRQTATLS
ncbi:U3 small nucleolar RNA-associated protein 15 [Marchantia polymorpha subsp. ruderalis]|uniref:U3 small nucleolar RNA-associated protein 15 C-terminal domain-containing protein n=2 Tax=Marchantia polymorpha TaxID=3197 RepID=A0AAF6B4Z7_MARPO|nr:hypothetical protein MARPO_0066s0060 [Marchantia polymorpha]BBN07081.1 hypothetical protein Mp_4g00830 [Marchantia polymorpha subsp. ruderalis]|eukprot:PTQ36103.1 hypothetical protein MARPO_0066s0060 [Marchantia polymorpha]